MDDQGLPPTQDLHLSQNIPEKPVGFLGVNGIEYPLINGVNKIGRKKDTCNVCLDLDSVSREHAVIAIHNAHKITIMDINSRNKTMLGMLPCMVIPQYFGFKGALRCMMIDLHCVIVLYEEEIAFYTKTTLWPYLSYPLSSGDVLQFGEVMAIFRLFEPDDDLPLTQDVSEPETPIAPRNYYYRNVTTVPETPEKDLINNSREKLCVIENKMFLKPNKVDQKDRVNPKKCNNESAKPVVLNFDLNESKPSNVTLVKNRCIYDLETQIPYQEVDIFDAETQLPPVIDEGNLKNQEVDICDAQAQSPSLVVNDDQINKNYNIRNEEAELTSEVSEHSSRNQQDYIYNAETQLLCKSEPQPLTNNANDTPKDSLNSTKRGNSKENGDTDFQSIDTRLEDIKKIKDLEDNLPFHEDVDDFTEFCQSQSLLTNVTNEETTAERNAPSNCIEHKTDTILNNTIDNVISMAATQKIPLNDIDDDEKTDCEDDLFEEEEQNKRITNHEMKNDKELDNDIADLPTQIIVAKPIQSENFITIDQENDSKTYNEDQPTQILDENGPDPPEDLPTQILGKSKEIPSPIIQNSLLKSESAILNLGDVNDENYYLATQDIVNDLNSPLTFANSTTKQVTNKNQSETIFHTPFPVKKTKRIRASEKRKESVKTLSNPNKDTEDLLCSTKKTKIREKEGNVNHKSLIKDQSFFKSGVSKINPIDLEVISEIMNKKEKEMNKPNEIEMPEKLYKTRNRKKINGSNKNLDTEKKIDQLPIENKVIAEKVRVKNQIKKAETKNPKKNITNAQGKIDQLPIENKVIAEKVCVKNQIKKTETKNPKKNITNAQENIDRTSINQKAKVPFKRSANELHESEKSDNSDVTLRRSRRQRTSNNKYENHFNTEITLAGCKRTRKTSNKSVHMKPDESTVYDTSNEDFPAVRKRPVSDLDFPSNTKKAKPNDTIETNCALENRRRKQTQHVLFTALSNDKLRDKLVELGAVMVNDVQSCTVVVTEQLRRTFKLMCAIGLGKPIVGHGWIQACLDARVILDPWQHLIMDPDGEKKLNFNLRQVLAAKRYFLKNYNVSCTPSVQPAPPELRAIVECSGGVWREGGPRWLCVWASADRALLPALAARGATLVSRDVFLGCVMRQRLDLPPPHRA